jgi:hypothetical protein
VELQNVRDWPWKNIPLETFFLVFSPFSHGISTFPSPASYHLLQHMAHSI